MIRSPSPRPRPRDGPPAPRSNLDLLVRTDLQETHPAGLDVSIDGVRADIDRERQDRVKFLHQGPRLALRRGLAGEGPGGGEKLSHESIVQILAQHLSSWTCFFWAFRSERAAI